MAKLPDGRCRRGFDLVPPQELSLRRQKSFHDKGHLRGRYCLGVGKPAPINCSLLRVGAALRKKSWGAGEKRYPPSSDQHCNPAGSLPRAPISVSCSSARRATSTASSRAPGRPCGEILTLGTRSCVGKNRPSVGNSALL